MNSTIETELAEAKDILGRTYRLGDWIAYGSSGVSVGEVNRIVECSYHGHAWLKVQVWQPYAVRWVRGQLLEEGVKRRQRRWVRPENIVALPHYKGAEL